jgi:hypothetical protein
MRNVRVKPDDLEKGFLPRVTAAIRESGESAQASLAK